MLSRRIFFVQGKIAGLLRSEVWIARLGRLGMLFFI